MKDLTRLFRYVRSYLLVLAAALFLLVLTGALDTLITALVAPIFDGVLSRSDAGSLVIHKKFSFIYKWLELTPGNILPRIALAMVVLTFVKCVGLFFSDYFMSLVGQSVVMRLRNDLYGHLMNQSVGFFSLNPTGRLMARVTSDVEKLQEAVSHTLADFVRQLFLLFFLVFLIFAIDWKLALVSLVIAPVVMFSTFQLGRRIRRMSWKGQEQVGDLSHVLQETLSGHRIVKAFGMEQFEKGKFFQATRKLLHHNLKVSKIVSLSSPLMEFMGVLSFVPMLTYAHHAITVQRALTPGAFVVFLGALFRMYDPLRKLSRIHIHFQQAFASSGRIFELLDTHIEVHDRPNAFPLPRIQRCIEFKDVHFEYRDFGEQRAALRNLNLRIDLGAIVALVGSSGSGKTTLVNLLPRFYDVTSGSIAIDGRDIRDVTLQSLRSQIAVVTQETFLFNDTIRNNIAYGSTHVSDATVVEAARAALAHEFILQLPQGYETVIGERGVRLSGGQRQRLSIARALLKDAPILILDEATSSLDSESELLVQEALANLLRNRTTLVIAHRLSTIRRADVIVVLEDGEIKEIGTHDSLLTQGGIYRRLYQLQFVELNEMPLRM